MKRLVLVWLLLVGGMTVGVAVAKEAAPVMGDAVMQERVMKLSGELRCLVCQGQSLADSHSDFAIDMRNKIMALMNQGMSDQEVKEFLVDRYGEFILYSPPFSGVTTLVWLGPLVLFALGAGVLFFNLNRRRQTVTEASLSPEELTRVNSLLNKESGDKHA